MFLTFFNAINATYIVICFKLVFLGKFSTKYGGNKEYGYGGIM
jgi:hypothetical protein